jgi:predicted phosphoribosyltransferase
VLGLPRGGVPVAFEVAKAIGADLGVLVVRKIGAPGQDELGIGAIVDGTPPTTVLLPEMVRATGASAAHIAAVEARETAEIERRRDLYRSGPFPALVDRIVIVVDDGIATGASMRAALTGLAGRGAARIVLAVPVAPAQTLDALAPLVDETVCLAAPHHFGSVGSHYVDFDQTSDAEVIALLGRRAR